MHWPPSVRSIGALLLLVLVAASCTSEREQAMALAVVPAEPSPTAVATTAPLAIPTSAPATPTAVPTSPPATPTAVPTPPPATPTAVPTPPPATPTAVPTAPPATPVPATPVPVPTATAVPATAVPATAVPVPTATAVPAPTATDVPGGVGGGFDHVVTTVGYVTLGQAGSVQVTMPAARAELIGFHEASHPGSQAINAAGTGLELMVLESRGRGTPARSAADIVVPPGEPLRAPVTGTVVAAKSYVLYCEHTDKLVYIEPDGLPGWQVRLFHVAGDIPAVGTRVIAGETIIASGGANPLPFESQIDEFTAEPSWPHAHVEVVDTNVPDTRPPGGGC